MYACMRENMINDKSRAMVVLWANH